MAQYQYAQKQDYVALTALWRTCFGDRESEIEAFWRIVEPTVFLAKEQGRVVSMACALPMPLVDSCGENLPAVYLYAVCTTPEFRGRGLCRGLLDFAHEELKKSAEFSVLVPAGTDLFAFYERYGYQTACYHKKYHVAASGTAKIGRIDIDAYRNLREMQLYGDYLSCDAPLLQWQSTLSEAYGGGLFRIETAECICCAAAEKCGETLIVKELLPDCPEAAAALAQKLGCKDAEVRTNELCRPFGMIRSLGSQPVPGRVYLGLAFD